MIPFNKPYYSGKEKKFIAQAMDTKILTGDTASLRNCETQLERRFGFPKVMLTNSCTMALEMAALMIGIQPGDEVIMPSFTYVSTANAFALRGATIVFADSRKDQPNVDEKKINALINERTKAIVVMHYAGVCCDLEVLRTIADEHGIFLIEDAAQCIGAGYKEKYAGTIGDVACFSLHETKNIHCGEGGFLVVNNKKLIGSAEIVRHKGTNRLAFSKGEVQKYEWVGLGFSSLPSAINTAFLEAQLQQLDKVGKKRLRLWKNYFRRLKPLQRDGKIGLPSVPRFAKVNGHIFYIVCSSVDERTKLISFLANSGIQAVFHYQSLHNSPYYRSEYSGQELPNADHFSSCLLRLPMYFELNNSDQDMICTKIEEFYVRN